MVRSTCIAVAMVVACVGCGPDGEEMECADVPADCSPQYEPTFDNIHSRTLSGSCALTGGACHANAGGQGGLQLENSSTAYESLTAEGRVVPGDAACSLIVRRLYSDDAAEQMPPGKPLSRGERCAIVQWIDDGAPR